MRIHIIYRYYWPDTTPYAGMLKAIAERWVAEGHQVTVFTAQPSYNDIQQKRRPWTESIGGVKVFRTPLMWERKSILLTRLINSYLFLSGSVVFGLFVPGVDLVMTHSSPPVFMGATAMILSKLRRSPYLYHCQDLNPEAALYGGALRKGIVSRLMLEVEKTTHRQAEAVVVLSEDMARTVRARGLPGHNLHILNNFIIERKPGRVELPPELRKPPGVYRVIFAGNHGVFQGLEYVIEAAWRLKAYPDIHFLFVGEGVAKPGMRAKAGELDGKTVFFHPYVPLEVAYEAMQTSDLGLIPLQPDLFRVAYPSKTMMLLAAGLPVLVVVEAESELAHFVRSERVGVSCPPRDAGALADAVIEAYQGRDTLDAQRQRARCVAEEHFGLGGRLEQWCELMRQIHTDP